LSAAPEKQAAERKKGTIIIYNNTKRNILLYVAMVVSFAIVGIIVPDVSGLREEVSHQTREEVREEITAGVTARMLYEYPDASHEDISAAVVYAIEGEVSNAVSSAVAGAFGFWVLLPALFLIVYIFATRRIIEALTLATVLGFIVGYRGGFFGSFSGALLNTLMGEDMAWLIIVCGLMGGIVALIERSGGGMAFGTLAAKIAKTSRPTLFSTMLCSLLLSIDDYLSVLASGSAMTPVNDRHRTPREMTAYVVDSASAPACVLNPISTWSLFIGGLLVANGLGQPGQQVLTYVRLVPFNFYAIATLFVLTLVIAGVIPKFGPMRGAFRRVAQGGPLAPPGSERIDIRSGQEKIETPKNPKLYNFFVPIIVLVATTIFFEFDMQKGVISAVGFCFIFFVFQGMKPVDFVDEILRGLKNMLMPILLVVLAFSFADMSKEIGFVYYVVDVATQNVTPSMLFVTIFLVFVFTEFIMGISWGMYVIALPIAIPVAVGLGVDPYIAAAAVVSAGVFGSHSCFYSDSTILTSAATGCDNFRHAITQIPFGLIGATVAAVGYTILGIVMYG